MDPTEDTRRKEQERLNTEATERTALETRYGKVWSTQELSTDFAVMGFMAPYVVVSRKSDNKKGSLEFQHNPRLYFNFVEDK